MTMSEYDSEALAKTDPRRIRYSIRGSTAYDDHQNALTIPRKQTKKKMFFGEYDATAEEEQSLINSHIGGNDRVTGFNGSQ